MQSDYVTAKQGKGTDFSSWYHLSYAHSSSDLDLPGPGPGSRTGVPDLCVLAGPWSWTCNAIP